MIEEGAWSEAVGSALSKLGVHVLDSQVLPLRELGSGRELIHGASGLGVVSAVRAATAGELSRVSGSFSEANLSAEERTQLCSFLLQVCRPSHLHPFGLNGHSRGQHILRLLMISLYHLKHAAAELLVFEHIILCKLSLSLVEGLVVSGMVGIRMTGLVMCFST